MASNIDVGKIFFELSFVDKDLQIPMVTTLVFLRETTREEECRQFEFLVVDGLLSSHETKNVALLNIDQVGELLDHAGLAARLRGLPSIASGFDGGSLM